MTFPSLSERLFNRLARLMPKSSLWHAALALVFVGCGLALFFADILRKHQSQTGMQEKIIQQKVREGQRSTNLPIGASQ